MTLLAGIKIVQLGDGLAAAVCGRLFADLGAAVSTLGADDATPLAEYLNHAKPPAPPDALASADLIIAEGGPAALAKRGHGPETLRRANLRAVLALISPYGQTGPKADEPATDLTLLYASGIAHLLTGQVDDLAEPPMRPVGEQSAFIGGIAAACAAMQALLSPAPGAVIDVSIEEALATMAMTELARAGLGKSSRPRRRVGDGNGATVCILPARDGYAAVSPREDRQWAAWLKVMGSPDWGADPRFAAKPDRVANFDALHTLMSEWSRQHDKQWIADQAQDAHVPSFPLREPEEQLASPQLAHRHFYRPVEIAGKAVDAPSAPFGLTVSPGADRAAPPAGALPLSGVRVLDFSWVIAGPTTTRYLAAMGAEVIKIEAPGRGDPGRATELHTVLGQAKKAIVLDLKQPEAVETARALAAKSDVLIENFATGVMDRLGLGAEALRAVNPSLIYVSASGLGRTGPEAHAVAYGTLLQCYAGFAGLNRHPGIPPRVGFAWLDPMCGLMLATVTAAALWHRRREGAVARVDFSMIEALLWTMAEPLIATRLGEPPKPQGNRSARFVPHSAYRCAGDDAWIALAVTNEDEWNGLCAAIPAMAHLAEWGPRQRGERRGGIDGVLTGWASRRSTAEASAILREAGIPHAVLANSADLAADKHLHARGFWDAHDGGALPGLPWRSTIGRATGPAPGLGADTDAVLAGTLGLSPAEIAALRHTGALG
jgi:crotonobetainyl-CoA:carnitine CoA-transferase CaiB-like acyl-CoA transferase